MANPSTLAGINKTPDISEEESNETKRTPFGTRYLNDPGKVFEHNAWDNMTWTEEQISDAQRKIAENSQTLIDDNKQEVYENDADKFWDEFYSKHQNRFFKDRHWLFKEFPELSTQPLSAESDGIQDAASGEQEKTENESSRKQRGEERNQTTSGAEEGTEVAYSGDSINTKSFPGSHCTRRYLEVGCGVGNTVFPILQTNNDPDLFVYGCDFSPVAIDLVKSNPDYDLSRCYGFVFDITDPEAELPFPEGSLDMIILIFVLSAVHPDKMQYAITRLASFLKPGGMILLRDYGKYDLAQLRFKPGRCLSENFYVRGDGTRVYFFTQDELKNMFTVAGLKEEQNLIDRRLQVNRGRQITMYRVWIQCKYRKPDKPAT
ncbi:putative methyltransferase-like protein 2-A-like [Apostichopus japonicus]|uniref:tRNA N(3)-methylcytidine methyltransferase n=1 Tax=Stichopus japonicus TaxID=307972 RepID=A0A2G8K0T7_STIJA|nr:putative methyltransferase-like protein 2-A-like [Apostichopus japonicus]